MHIVPGRFNAALRAPAILAVAMLAGCAGALDPAGSTQCVEPGQPLQASLVSVIRSGIVRDEELSAASIGAAPQAMQLVRPEQIAVSGPDVYIADTGVGAVLRTDRMGSTFARIATLPATRIGGLAADRLGDVLIALPADSSVRLFPRGGGPARSIGEASALASPADVVTDGVGRIDVADALGARVVRFNRIGQVTGIIGERGDRPGPFTSATALALDEGALYVLDGVARKVHVMPITGAPHVLDLGAEARFPGALAVDRWGRIFVADRGRRALTVLQGAVPQIGDLGGTPPLQQPTDVAVDDSGLVYVADGPAAAVYVFAVPRPCP